MIEKQELKKVLTALFQANRDISNNSAMRGVLECDEREIRTAIQIHGAAKGVMMVADYFGIDKEELEVELPEEEVNEVLKKCSENGMSDKEREIRNALSTIVGAGANGFMKN